MRNKIGVYIHFPYCEKKCPYCDFNSHVTKKIEHERFLEAYKKDFDHHFAQLLQKPSLESIFFGGGTPSLMEPFVVEGIIDYIKNRFLENENEISPHFEVTLEANPSSFEVQKFRDFKNSGVNRLSIGVQSFIEEDLQKLGRVHNKTQAIEAILHAGEIFDRLSFDLIYARENQELQNWRDELTFALQTFNPSHISLYSLTIEKGTEFFKMQSDGKLSIPKNQEEFYDITNEVCAEFGLNRYEISNYAKENYECKHNILYWQTGQYIGIGAGAHGRINAKNGRIATMNFNAPEKYLLSVEKNGNALQINEVIDAKTIAMEQITTGLRTIYGFEIHGIEQFLALEKAKILEQEGLVIQTPNRIIPTKMGLSLCDGIARFIFRE
jgi:putative oxygen-independent coproporphyrinogen III oxidase